MDLIGWIWPSSGSGSSLHTHMASHKLISLKSIVFIYLSEIHDQLLLNEVIHDDLLLNKVGLKTHLCTN